MRTGTGVSGVIEGDAGSVVTLDDGSTIEADVVVVGIGIVPTTDWLEGSGIELDNGVVVDATLHATDDVLAAGMWLAGLTSGMGGRFAPNIGRMRQSRVWQPLTISLPAGHCQSLSSRSLTFGRTSTT